jgi:glycosyltransferase involved in cell wall biosynthesis
MRILTALTYYRPHYSGLTIYAERLARALGERGHHVTVLTSQYDRSLPRREALDGVEIIRLPVRLRISKGVIMPSILYWAWRLARQSDVVNLHLPQLDAAPISAIGRLLGKPVVLTYHCDLRLPDGLVHAIANQMSHLANHVSAGLSDTIATNTLDYAENSAFLHHYLSKVQVIPPPVSLPSVTEADLEDFRLKAGVEHGQRIIGMAARLATEKGVEYLVEALPSILQKHPGARVLFVGQYQHVFGEEAYAQSLAPLIQELGRHWTFMGILPPVEFAAFLRTADVLVLPSINSTESFGLVQVEAMTCGTPVVSTDLPGVRQPVRMTGMGRIVPPSDAEALAQAIIAILDNPGEYQRDIQAILQQFSPQAIAEDYEAAFETLLNPAGRQPRQANVSRAKIPRNGLR